MIRSDAIVLGAGAAGLAAARDLPAAGLCVMVLHRAVAGTLFFAGEATDAEQAGTVAGAVASGRRAARELLRATT